MVEDDDLREVIESEKRRGVRRRPLDAKARSERKRVREDLRALISRGDEQAFVNYLLESGQKEGSPEFQKALKTFRDEVRKHG